MSDNLLTDLIEFNRQSCDRLTDVINGGAGFVVEYAPKKSYTVTKLDIERAHTTSENLSQPYSAEYLGDLQIRMFEQLTDRLAPS